MQTNPRLASEASANFATIVGRFLLRFVLAYWVIYKFPFPFGGLPHTDRILGPYERVLNAGVVWVGTSVFGANVDLGVNRTDDATFNCVLFLIKLIFAGGAALAWSVASRSKAVSPRVVDLVRTYVRYALAKTLFDYGWYKVFLLQFAMLGPERLMTPYGDSSPMGLLWRFIGASAPYEIFSGTGEVLAGMLLLFRRTALLGALIASAVLLNVIMLNFCYDVPVKLLSVHLLLMALFIMAPHWTRLAAIFVLNRAAQPVVLRPFSVKSPALGWARVAVKAAFILLVMVIPVYRGYQNLYTTGPLAPRQGWEGIYRVESFQRGDVADRALGDDQRWVRVGLVSRGMGTIQHADGSSERRMMRINPVTHAMNIRGSDGVTSFILSFNQDGPDELVIEGVFEGLPTVARLKREMEAPPLLTTRGFHWINEYPLNR
jgi:hypothetical protein